MPRDISKLLLERYRLGELDGNEKLRVDIALSQDRVLREELAALEKEDALFLLRHPLPSTLIEADAQKGPPLIHGRPPSRIFVIRKRKVAIAAAAALVLCALGLPLYRGLSPLREDPGVDRMKGGTVTPLGKGEGRLTLFVRRGGGEERLKDGAILKAGETVQLAYRVDLSAPKPSSDTPSGVSERAKQQGSSSSGAKQAAGGPKGAARDLVAGARNNSPEADDGEEGLRYGVIFSVDGRNTVTLHYPYRSGGNTLLSTGKQIPLHEAYTLDDAPYFESFFLLISRERLLDAPVLEKVRELLQKNANPGAEKLKGLLMGAFPGLEIQSLWVGKE